MLIALPAMLVVFGVFLTVPGCPDTPKMQHELDTAKVDTLGLRMQKIKKAMADETAKTPAKARDIAAKYAKPLQYIDDEVAKLPEALRAEFAQKYGKK